jgi:aspartate carbamoyltransferase catalytic subunit
MNIDKYHDTYIFKHIIETQQFNAATLIKWIFPLADRLKTMAKAKNSTLLAGKRMISWFEEPSTRTAASFASSMSLLGGQISFSTENAAKFSSRAKGESIEDTLRILNGYYPDIIVARLATAGDAYRAAQISAVPIINAGDGNNQHPTQALLDLYTMYQKFGQLDNLTIGLVGDLHNGRTVKSLCYLAGKFKDITLHLVSPLSLRLGDDIKNYLDKHRVNWSESDDLQKIASHLDVVYMTRIQEERGSKLADEELEPGRFSINRPVLRQLAKSAIIMHPLPRLAEIPSYVDRDKRAYYFKQAQNGLYIRMALLVMVLRPQVVPSLLLK